ncbi:MAG TPA: TetR/AcrR family transcriptional regulator [Baekduia sp.]|jgi:AcrR family transcriptional regulator|nr:TetR/AcrR family transcriptional regulator [Baekduia sp.]
MAKTPAAQDTDIGGTRQVILAAAAKLFRERGFAETTTRDLGKAAGIRGPSLYHHFETKQDLLFGVCRESVRRLRVAADGVPPVGTVDEQLDALILTHVETVVSDPDLHAVAMVDSRALTGERRAAIVEAREGYERRIERLIKTGQEQGTIRSDMSAHDVTLFLFSMLNWTLFWQRTPGSADASQLAVRLSRLFFDGANAQSTEPLTIS